MKAIDSAARIGYEVMNTVRLFTLCLFGAIVMAAAPVSAMPAALVRVAHSADSISSQILGFVVICAIVGLNLLADRRRRSRARSSAS